MEVNDRSVGLPLVTIRCCTYNHEKFIRQTLDGFVMQKTDFPFEAIVHDDASTDGTAAIIRKYAEKYPDIIKPIIEKENQYSKKDGSLLRILNAHTKGKYAAICEGDDYWTDPLKLQKQVDYMEAHSNCTMTCSRVEFFSEARQCVDRDFRIKEESQVLPTEDVIIKGGNYIATCSEVMRTEILFEKGKYDYIKNCWVGDHPTQLLCAMKGDIYYFDEKMAVYRVDNVESWSGKIDVMNDNAFEGWCSIIEMLLGFSKDFPRYKEIFEVSWNKYIRTVNHNFFSDSSKLNELKTKYWNVMTSESKRFWYYNKYVYPYYASCRHTIAIPVKRLFQMQ